ncbi:MAG: 2-C-methyl-D-erythritol 2,4-cyclodiphosphate synthase [Crocinitomicaceae bacterium]|nr:2-C-methyl-D-erythritol 2,4-cyclodiphosphate synthase [Crocinitomicaceae bacterium]
MIPNIRTGFGVDIHQLVSGRDLIIGGVHIPSDHGALGHSDADVLLHSICDALLGAANLRDIGYHFSDTDPQFKGIDSKLLLKESYRLVKEKGYQLVNLDSTVLLERPKLNPHIPLMRANIAEILEVDQDAISIKATRGEKMGYVGNGEGIQAYASVLIFKA